MGRDRACRYEPEAARELEQRENRGGGGTSVLDRDGRRTGPQTSRQRGPLRRLSLLRRGLGFLVYRYWSSLLSPNVV